MSIIINETFTNSDGILLQNHSSSWIKYFGTGNFAINSNRAVLSSALNARYYYNLGVPNGTITCNIIANNFNYLMISFRQQDTTNMYFFDPISYQGLYKKVNAVDTLLLSVIKPTANYTYQIIFDNSTMYVYVDTVLQGSVIDTAFTTGYTGFWAETLTEASDILGIDNFQVDSKDIASSLQSGSHTSSIGINRRRKMFNPTDII